MVRRGYSGSAGLFSNPAVRTEITIMQWMLFVALSAIAAILWNPVNNFLTAQSAKATSTGAVSFFGSYAGKTAITAAGFFVVLLVAATVLNFVSRGSNEVPVLGKA